MKASTGHILFDKKIRFKDLAKHIEDIVDSYLKESRQTLEEPGYTEMVKALNKAFLERGTKPEGMNRPGKMRLVFPIREDDVIEIMIISSASSMDVVRVTESLSALFHTKNLKHELVWDAMPSRKELVP